jgi:hypothetical protein
MTRLHEGDSRPTFLVNWIADVAPYGALGVTVLESLARGQDYRTALLRSFRNRVKLKMFSCVQ